MHRIVVVSVGLVLSVLIGVGLGATTSLSEPTVKTASGDLAAHFNSFVAAMPRQDSGAYDAPTASERSTMAAAYDAVEAGDLSRAASLVDPLGYDVVQYRDTVSGRDLILLSERRNADGSWPHAWGMYVFSPASASDTAVEVPHPVAEVNVEDVGVELFRKANAEDLFIAGAHRYANTDGSADVAHEDSSVFDGIHEAAVESATDVVQPHGFSQASHPDCGEVAVSAGKAPPTDLARKVHGDLRGAGFDAVLYDGNACPDLGATTNVQGVSTRAAGADFLHVEISKPIRDDATRRSLLSDKIAGALGGTSGTQVSLLPPGQIGAQAAADIGFANLAPPQTADKVRHVDPNGADNVSGTADDGSDANAGTRDRPWRTVNKAASTLRSDGFQVAYVHGGAYNERVTTINGGSATAPLWLLEAPGESAVIKGDGTSGNPFIRITRPYWVIDGFEISAGGSQNHAIRFQTDSTLGYDASHAVVRNVNVGGGTGPAAVVFQGASDAALLNSKVHDYKFGNNDSHGVAVLRGSKRILIKGTDSWGNDGDDVQCADGDAVPNTDDPSDVTIEGNRYGNTHPGGVVRTRTRENAVDVKTCRNVTIRGNKLFGFRPSPVPAPNSSPHGDAIVIHENASRVLIEGNRIWNSGRAASIGASNGTLGPIVFRRNLLFDMATGTDTAGLLGDGVRISHTSDAEIYHNTFYNLRGKAITVGDSASVGRADVINNIVQRAGTGFSKGTVTTLTVGKNLFYETQGIPEGSTVADPMFIEDPRNDDFYTKPGSPARDVAMREPLSVDPSNPGHCGDGPDIGFLESCTSAPTTATLVGAGDIATGGSAAEATAKLVRATAGTVFTAGDNVYEGGTLWEFNNYYHPTWGTERARTKPSPGNHEYVGGTTKQYGAGYFDYFGAAAGSRDEGYYSYDLGAWHVISLNSMCEYVGGCDTASPMVTWLKNDLAANADHQCTLAYFHHPLFSSGEHGNASKMRPTWDALYAANADVVVNGHDHSYERFAPQSPGGAADPARGIREFVVGTGGAGLRPFEAIKSNSEVRNADTHGVLKFTLNATSYDWQFVPVAGKTFTDSGSTSCH